jgi:hypothetical protein
MFLLRFFDGCHCGAIIWKVSRRCSRCSWWAVLGLSTRISRM